MALSCATGAQASDPATDEAWSAPGCEVAGAGGALDGSPGQPDESKLAMTASM
jgi:hypothetical protein